MLWIGFKLYLCLIDYQQMFKDGQQLFRCELVSNCIFVLLIINYELVKNHQIEVVNWFQIVSLSYWLSTLLIFQHLPPGCELVSNCIFVLLIINLSIYFLVCFPVVNWFQIVSLSYWLSTILEYISFSSLLWIGFKLYLCLIDYQRTHNTWF